MKILRRVPVLLCAAVLYTTVGLTGGLQAGEEPVPSGTQNSPQPILQTDLTPENTIIISSEADRQFCRDFSAALGDVSLEWVVLSEPAMPEALKEQNLLIIGQPDSPVVGTIIQTLIAEDESKTIDSDGYAISTGASPWQEGRVIIVAAGKNMQMTKTAAEQALLGIMPGGRARAGWYRSAGDIDRGEVEDYIRQFQYLPEDEGLPQDDMRVDSIGSPRRVTAAQAAEDVEYLFEVLSHGWCGYGYFSARGDFDAVRARITAELHTQKTWSPGKLGELIRDNLDFVHDCHLNINNTAYCQHKTFWSGRGVEVGLDGQGYYIASDVGMPRITAIDGEDAGGAVFPSLNAAGEPVYRIGKLAYTQPTPMTVTVESASGQVEERRIPLVHTDYIVSDRFMEERIGGIPVLRAPSFADYYSDELGQWVQAAGKYKEEPYVIIDIRGNGGGNTRWPKTWITRFTGYTPSLAHVLTELVSTTTMTGRANLFSLMLESYPEEDAGWIETERGQAARRAEQVGDAPYWTAPQIPALAFIPNNTTLIVLVDDSVASAGEGMLSYLYQQVENVVVVGENSMGAVTFGQVSTHQLPNSHLAVTVPIKLNAMADMSWREESGYLPDLWVPAGEALNYAVAAVRRGTIGTQMQIPPGYLAPDFRPEKVRRATLITENLELAGFALLMLVSLAASLWFGRGKPQIMVFGAVAIALGGVLITKANRAGYVMLAYGAVLLIAGAAQLVMNRRQGSSAVQAGD